MDFFHILGNHCDYKGFLLCNFLLLVNTISVGSKFVKSNQIEQILRVNRGKSI